MGHKKTYSDHLELFSKSFLVQNIREWWSLGVILGQVRTGLAAQESPQSSFEVPLSILQFLSLYKNIESLPRNVDSKVRSYFRDDSTNQRFIVLGQANKISTHSEWAPKKPIESSLECVWAEGGRVCQSLNLRNLTQKFKNFSYWKIFLYSKVFQPYHTIPLSGMASLTILPVSFTEVYWIHSFYQHQLTPIFCACWRLKNE